VFKGLNKGRKLELFDWCLNPGGLNLRGALISRVSAFIASSTVSDAIIF